jgi:uncharacterized membrane protein
MRVIPGLPSPHALARAGRGAIIRAAATLAVMTSDVPVDLYLAVYDGPDTAQDDWDAIKALARDDVITLLALVLLSREQDGKIHVKDNGHEVGVGAAIGAVGGALVGLIFPPALLASAAVGAGLGAGTGGLVDHRMKKEIKADVENDMPPGSSAILAVFEERWMAEIEQALAKAERLTRHKVDKASLEGAPA